VAIKVIKAGMDTKQVVARAVEASGATQTLEGAHNAMHAVRVLVR
jgi:hypothetical protein